MGRRLFLPVIETDKWNTSLIDHVEPFDMLAPVENPTAPPAPAPANAQPQRRRSGPCPPVAARQRSQRRRRSRPDRRPAPHAFSRRRGLTGRRAVLFHQHLVELFGDFGAAAVAVGGYDLALREADRSQGRSIPRGRYSAETSANAGRRPCEAPELTTQTLMAGSFSLPANFVSYITVCRTCRDFVGSTSAGKASCG